MREKAVRYLRCPHCAGSLRLDGRTLLCPERHSFDLARQGYANLLRRATRFHSDTPEMVDARADFLAAEHFRPLTDALAARAREAFEKTDGDGCVLDVGGGTGHYQAAVLDALPDGTEGVLLDISKPAVRRAARAHPRISAVVADAWDGLPLVDNAARLALNVFAPRDAAELARVLRPDGTLLAVVPRPEHLAELVTALDLLRVEEEKADRLADRLAPHLVPADRQEVTATLTLDHTAVRQVVAMGPNSWHQEPARLAARVAELPPTVTTTLAVTLAAFRPAT
ncbi:putative RNA methyltransferase [Streptomyces alkaliterrae]|uniref:Methyltransferase domain-containing protein n=1 Tax=Streptomyces alkaliterrae TaxID=2213162 RepID=A0A5P0YXH6_9ACTN|nr:methyltransferase domain-containing protein [Streptomyces alkaliterrae]MBB1255818.1 methyltransferase domain-containing protein [Streptomyces alkaliterrae]MBB1259690.1 methyltransferase domain-containing protein [Streptomyces alkaliterrae]MQS04212.1 methyltransferase domain-containing protein [Streptomyces alkaliterrae]